MSEVTPTPPVPASEPKKLKKRRTWKQRLKITAIVLIVAAVFIRIGLNFLLPTVVRKVANAYDLDCTYDRMSLSLLSGNAHIWNLELRPKSGGDSIVQADYIQGSLSTPNLFRGRLIVYRAEVDGVDMLIDREPDGSIPLLKRLISPPADSPIAVAPEPATTEAGQPVNLQAPLRIDAIRVSHVNTTFRDRSVTPTFQTTIRTTLRISDIGSNGAPAEFELQVAADPILDTLIISGVMHNTPTVIDADLNVLVRGLHPKPAAAYLMPLGLRPIADDITITARANLTAESIPATTDVSGRLAVSDVIATVDSTDWASLKTVSLDAKKLNPSAIELGRLLIEAGRVSARRSAEGRMQFAGFEWVPVPAGATDSPPTAVAPTGAPVSPEAPVAPVPFRLSLDEMRLADLQAKFDDQAVLAEGELIARLDELTARNIVFDTANANGAIAIDGSAAMPGVIKTINWSGTIVPFGDTRQAKIAVQAEGIKPDALRPYLEAVGLQSQFAAGVFTTDIQATSTADDRRISVWLDNTKLTDGGATLVDLSSVAVTGVSVSPYDGAIHVQAIDLAGPTLTVRREADGALAALGLRTITDPQAVAAALSAQPVAANPATASVPVTPAPTKPADTRPPTLPRVQIDRIAWRDIGLNFEDHYGAQSPVILAGRAGVEAADLIFDPSATQATKPGRFHAWLEVPGVVDELALDGSLETTDQGVTIASDLTAEGITGASIQSYLTPLGIELMLTGGRLQAKAGATVTQTDTLRLDVDLTDMSYTDGDAELAGIDALRIEGLAVQPGNIAVDLVQIVRPRGRVARNADGNIEAAGVRLIPPPPSTQPAAPQVVTTGPPAPLNLPPAPITLLLKQIRIDEGTLQVIDQAVQPALDTVLHGSVQLDNASVGANDQPAQLAVTGSVDGIVGSASVTGNLALATDSPGVNLVIKADQLRGNALDGYLPPGMRSTLRNGQFAMAIDAELANHADGGLAGHLVVSDLLLQENADEVTLAKVGEFVVRVGRLDPGGGILAIDEISSDGIEFDIAHQPDGAIDALGVRVGDPTRPPPPPQPHAAAVEPPPVAVVATDQPPADVTALVADARRALPLLTIDTLDLKLDRLRIRGLAGPDAAPVNLANTRLHATGPIELAGDNPDQRPPLKLQIDGAVDPVVKQFAIVINATPFESEPQLAVDVNASGINGSGLTDVAPGLRNLIDGEGLTEGTFVARLVASMNYGRRGPRDVDLARGFTVAFSLKPLEFRGRPDGPVLAGIEEIRGDGISVQPRKGDVIIKSIEVVRPIGRFSHDEQGLHAMGVVIPLNQTETAGQPAEAVEDPPEPAPAATAVNAADSEPPQRPASEIRLDRFAVTGIDVVFEDRTSTPSTLVPLKTLDLEVRDVSNQLLWTGRPVRFDMLCTSDKVPLPPRKGISQGTHSGDALEMRELFSQITANGRIGMKQTEDGGATLTGWAKTSVNGFELLGVRGMAKSQKVIIGGGVFDDSNDIRFKDDGSIETRNRIVFTNLSLTEPLDGPIRRILQLPAPIDIAIGALTDPDGSITLNLPVTVESGEVDLNSLVAPAIGAVANVLATAIASAPIKAAGGVGDILGLGGRPAQAEKPVELTFVASVATLEPAEARQLAVLIDRMRRDQNLELQLRHEMSAADVAHAGLLANPPVEDVRVMIERMRRGKSRLLADRAMLAAQARAQFAAQADIADQSVATLRSIDRQLSRIDTSLDQLGDLLRPGAAAQADRRTRTASLAIAKERFDVIEAAIANARIANADSRVHRTNPQFDPIDSNTGGRVVITVVAKKK